MTTDTTHITKDEGEARKAEVSETEALKPCPFCGGKAFADQVCAPGSLPVLIAGCEVCGCTTRLRVWNTRAAEVSEPQPPDSEWADRVAAAPKPSYAELSAQESKPVDDPLKPLQDWYAALMKSGSLSINASMSMGHIIADLRAFVSAAQSGSAQDASPKDDEASSANDRAMAHYDE
jgi:hypothetical protein